MIHENNRQIKLLSYIILLQNIPGGKTMVKTVLHSIHKEKAGELIDYNLTLKYYIVSEPFCAEFTDLLRYGIKIKLIAEFEDGTSEEESKEIRDIFYREQDAYKFADILSKNSVTPTHLSDIVEEYIQDTLRGAKR